jgi:hypothetical protein
MSKMPPMMTSNLPHILYKVLDNMLLTNTIDELDESESASKTVTNLYPPGLFDDINEDAEEESN